jgi:predicted ribosome quality control (RQC) complex YloA/Tae2 family protein
MKQLSHLDLHFLLSELKVLENQRIDNFYLENEVFYIRLYVRGKGHLYLCNKISKFVYLDDKKTNVTRPSSFVQHLRKYLNSAFIRNIDQIESERILSLLIEKKEGEEIKKYYLFIELFSGGNVILCDEHYNIKNLYERKYLKDRILKVKERYKLPDQKDLSFYNLDKKKFIDLFGKSNLILVKFLAIKLGIGGKYAQIICKIANLDEKITLNISEIQFDEIYNAIKFILSNFSPIALLKNGKIEDFSPFDFETNEDKKSFESFNQLLKSYFSNYLINEDKMEKELENQLNKLKNRLDKQEKQFLYNDLDYENYNLMGNKIYENYAFLDNILKVLKASLKKKGVEYVKNIIEKTDDVNLKKIKLIDFKKQELVIDL